MREIILLCGLCVASVASAAVTMQATYQVHNKTPAPFANQVLYLACPTGALGSVKTNSEGKFKVPPLPPTMTSCSKIAGHATITMAGKTINLMCLPQAIENNGQLLCKPVQFAPISQK